MKDEKWIKDQLLDKFLRYVKIDTKSDPHKTNVIPSTEGQWDLLHMLKGELEELGVSKITLNEHGYLIAVVEANLPSGETAPVIGLMAHVDTSEDMEGKDDEYLWESCKKYGRKYFAGFSQGEEILLYYKDEDGNKIEEYIKQEEIINGIEIDKWYGWYFIIYSDELN